MLEAVRLHVAVLKGGLEDHTYRCNLLLRACARSGATRHADDVLRRMPSPNLVSFNTVLGGHLRHRRPDDALALFRRMPAADSRTWNILIAGLVRNQRHGEAAALFTGMLRGSVTPDDVTFAAVLPCCGLLLGRQVHALAVRVCSWADPVLGTNLARMYAAGGEIYDAEKVFEDMADRDLVAWNALISSYSKLRMGDRGLRLFRQMMVCGTRVDAFTIAAVLDEIAGRSCICGGMQIHSLMIKSDLTGDRFTCNALLNLYSKWGSPADVGKLFDEILEPDPVSWTLLIAAFSLSGRQDEAMETFLRMRISDVRPNSFTFGSLISSFCGTNSFDGAKQFHALILKTGLESDVVVGSAIVDTYSKCGDIMDGMKLFRSLPRKDLVSWNGIICGLAQNGEAAKAMEIFDEMVALDRDDAVPNAVTFVGLLSACSHGGLVGEGLRYFSKILPAYSISPQAEHYAIVIDILARAGLVEEAEAILAASPLQPDAVTWSTLLAACRKHGNLTVARRIAGKLLAGGREDPSPCVLLANLCSAGEEWSRASKIRELMTTGGHEKTPGNSWIEIRGYRHSFSAGLAHHFPDRHSLYDTLQTLQSHSFSLALNLG
ncbi:unnamed protein product [Spirodela intermedia]|uniref:Uncharacterized protein n=1 Tax=Spirodela intermedia TaxID=51605 RepID=A0A7I8L9L0_SPIIN|nr:unnamed protein product [Spirodela intermedia]